MKGEVFSNVFFTLMERIDRLISTKNDLSLINNRTDGRRI